MLERNLFLATLTLVVVSTCSPLVQGQVPPMVGVPQPSPAQASAPPPAIDDERPPGLDPLRPQPEPMPQSMAPLPNELPPPPGRDFIVGGGVALGVGLGLSVVAGAWTAAAWSCGNVIGWCPGYILAPTLTGFGLVSAISGAVLLGVGVKRERAYRDYWRGPGRAVWAPSVGRTRLGTRTVGAVMRF